MALSKSQKVVADRALSVIFGPMKEGEVNGFTIIGEGGTGKTYTVSEIVRVIVEANNVLMVAPTHKAVKQMQKSFRAAGLHSSRIAFSTVHSALGLALMPSDENKYVSPVKDSILSDFDLVVCDESSMLNKVLLERYLLPELLENGTFLLLMGDDMQLPPVKERKSSAFGLFETAELTENRRQLLNADGSENGILLEARRIRHAIKDSTQYRFEDRGLNNITCVQDRVFLATVLDRFTPETDFENTRCLAWTNARVDDLNHAIRHKLYGENREVYEIGERVITKESVKDVKGEVQLTTGEECIVTAKRDSQFRNPMDNEVWATTVLTLAPCYTGQKQVFATVLHPGEADRFEKELRRLRKIAQDAGESGRRVAWRNYWNHHDMFDRVGYCYAMTIHNSQGSTFDTVFLDVKDLLRNPNREERQRLLYVGWSRPRLELVINKSGFVA